MFVYHDAAGVNTIWDTMPKVPATRRGPELRSLIRDAMRAKGIKNVDGEQGLAKRAGVARNTIYAWEKGAYPRIGELERLARFLDLPAWQLLQAWEGGTSAIAEEQASYETEPTWARNLATRMTAIEERLSGVPGPEVWQALVRLSLRVVDDTDDDVGTPPPGSGGGRRPRGGRKLGGGS